MQTGPREEGVNQKCKEITEEGGKIGPTTFRHEEGGGKEETKEDGIRLEIGRVDKRETGKEKVTDKTGGEERGRKRNRRGDLPQCNRRRREWKKILGRKENRNIMEKVKKLEFSEMVKSAESDIMRN